jgi:2-polyprenyl-6-methoxyphenol hydroxylase-like FAD-dependent oxidoreductase
VTLHFADGATASGFKLVVGADGVRSKIRHLVRTFLSSSHKAMDMTDLFCVTNAGDRRNAQIFRLRLCYRPYSP